MSLWTEVRRRNVHRVAIAYVAGAWVLIQVAETLFPVFGLSDRVIQAVVILLAVGFFPAVILSWIFEWTPEGVRRDTNVTSAFPPAHTRRLDAAIIIMLVVAVAFFAVDKFVFEPARDAAEREVARQQGHAAAVVESFGEMSIVVLPFVNLSPDPEQQYLGDGLAEELLHLLAKVQGLRVISRTSAFSFKGTELTADQIAQKLNVRYVLEGSVRKAGDDLRITAQLIDARADAHVWSGTYDYSNEKIFDIQDAVAGEVVGHLQTELSLDSPAADRHHPGAYALYLQARQLSHRQGTEEQQVELLSRALKLSPTYLDAMVELAWAHRRSAGVANWAGDKVAADNHYDQFDVLIDEVLVQNPRHTGGNVSRAWSRIFKGDLRRAALYAERALQSEPNHFNALGTAGEIFNRLWRAERAIPILRYVSERDPLNPYHFENIANAYLTAGRYEAAEEAYRTLRLLAPDKGDWVPWGQGLALLLQGKSSEALQQFDEGLPAGHPLRWHGKALALHDLGRTEEALAELDNLLAVDRRMPNIYWVIGTAYAWLGLTDEAFEFFEEQRELNRNIFVSMGDFPLYTNLRDDPRWLPFLASVELDPETLSSIELEPTLPPELRLPDSSSDQD